MKIPLFRMPKSVSLSFNIENVLKSTWYSSGGEFTGKIENWFKEYLGIKYAVAVNSGTAACRAALWACLEGSPTGCNSIVKANQFVITPTFSCGANLSPLMEFGCKPIFVDVDIKTFGMTLPKAESAVAAFIPYIYGEPPRDIEPTFASLFERGVKVICDISECVGMDPKYFMGDIFVASVRAEKMLGAGEGGLIGTNDEELHHRILTFCSRGKPNPGLKYWYTTYGDNLLMPNITAAIACSQIETLPNVVAGKRALAKRYRGDKLLSTCFDWHQHSDHGVAWLNCGLLKLDIGIIAPDLIRGLANFGIDCRPAFYPLPYYWRNVYGYTLKEDPFDVADEIMRRGVVLPSPHDLSNEEFDYIIDSIKRILG